MAKHIWLFKRYNIYLFNQVKGLLQSKNPALKMNDEVVTAHALRVLKKTLEADNNGND